MLSSLSLILCLASIASAQAPATGRLTGTVRDQTGAILPGVVIVATHDRTQSDFQATTNEVGVWVMPSVPSGTYTVAVRLQGFRTVTQRNVKVDAAATVPVDVTLQVGLEDLVVVTASRYEQAVVNAPATASVIQEQTIRDAPTRNMADLLRAVPGVNVTQLSARQLAVTSRSATGVMPTSQLVLIDGRRYLQKIL
jgi:iron complex outermembrane receptor protein